MHVLLVAMLSPRVPSMTEYFTSASLGMVSGTSESLELVSVSDVPLTIPKDAEVEHLTLKLAQVIRMVVMGGNEQEISAIELH